MEEPSNAAGEQCIATNACTHAFFVTLESGYRDVTNHTVMQRLVNLLSVYIPSDSIIIVSNGGTI